MGEFTDASKNEMVDWLTGKDDPAATGTRYLAVYDGDPQGAGTEVTGTLTGGTTRPTLTSAMAAASSGSAANTSAIEVAAAADDAADATHWAIMDSATVGEGTVLASEALAASQSIAAGNPVSFEIGDLTVSITG